MITVPDDIPLHRTLALVLDEPMVDWSSIEAICYAILADAAINRWAAEHETSALSERLDKHFYYLELYEKIEDSYREAIRSFDPNNREDFRRRIKFATEELKELTATAKADWPGGQEQ